MSDTTPRPDETRDATSAPPTEAVPETDVPEPEPAPPADDTAAADPVAEAEAATPQAPPQPAADTPPAPEAAGWSEQQYPQPQYGQPPYPPPAAPGPAPTPYAPGQPPLSPQEERTWGMASHIIGAVAMVASAGLLGFVGSLVIYLVFKDRGPFVRAHSANSLNVQITAGIGFLVGWALTITIIGAIIGIPILIAVFIWAVIVHVIGAIKANNGEWWQPPMTPTFVS